MSMNIKATPRQSASRIKAAAALLAVMLVAGPAFAQEQTGPSATPAVQASEPAPAAAPAPPASDPAAAAPPSPGEPASIPKDAEDAGRSFDLPRNLSPWGMFMAADSVEKAVMIGLFFASLLTWTIWLVKTLELGGARLAAARASATLGRAATLSEAAASLRDRRGIVPNLVRAASNEVDISAAALQFAGGERLAQRVASRLMRLEAGAVRRMGRGTGLLATIGSTAPFVGLFGTVWGIMNAFIGISRAQTTNLAVVAPGIAEALLATAIGLVAAIPAVVIYNLFARWTASYRQRLADAAAMVERLVSRDLDFGAAPNLQRVAAEH